jgi:signal peptide peptidase SppA
MTSDLNGILGRLSRASLIAPICADGQGTAREILSLARDAAGFMANRDPDWREQVVSEHFRNVLSAYGHKSANGGTRSYPYAAGTAFIPVHGILINRFNYATPYVTGYNAIRAMLRDALADDDVKAIVLDVNSPGGQAAGCFELADDVRAARETKPVLAYADSMAFSAAYALASAAHEIALPASGEVGSIGVVAMHVDLSKALDETGIKVTFVYAGKHKVDGNPYEPLSDDARADIQAGVDALYAQFVSCVAAGRGERLSVEQARATEARCYLATDAVQAGLADSVTTPARALANFLAMRDNTFNRNKETSAVSDTEARAAERARIAAIIGHAEAEGRADLAKHLAFETDLSPEAAGALLAKAPKAEAKHTNALDAAMNQIGSPNIGAGYAESDAKMQPGMALITAYETATGRPLGKPN